MGICPEMNRRLPALMAGEYAHIAFGAFRAVTSWRIAAFAQLRRPKSGGLDDFAAAQTARADANAFGRAVDERAHSLQVGLESSWSHIMGVGNRPADHRTLVADLAPLGHKSSSRSLRAPTYPQAQTLNCSRSTARSGYSPASLVRSALRTVHGGPEAAAQSATRTRCRSRRLSSSRRGRRARSHAERWRPQHRKPFRPGRESDPGAM